MGRNILRPRFCLRNVSTASALSCAALGLMIFTASAALAGQVKKSPPRKPAASTWSKTDCGQGVELRLSASAASQGNLLLAEVRSAKPLTNLAGTWIEKQVPIWQEDAPKQTYLWHALMGIDLELAAGNYQFGVSGKSE